MVARLPGCKTDQRVVKITRGRRDVLASALLATDYMQSIARSQSDESREQRHPLADAIATHAGKIQLQSRRSLLTTTVFSTKDPDPYAANAGDVDGIRIERFSRRQQKFLAPAYIFMRRRGADGESAEDRWEVHRHTLPAGIPIRALAAKHLPDAPRDEDDGAKHPGGNQDLEAFVQEVTREVVSLLRRQEAVEAITAAGIKTVAAVNAEATDVRIVWKDGAAARVRVSKSGFIENVVAEREYARDEELERRILAAGSIASLGSYL